MTRRSTRERLQEEALTLFAERGFDGVTVDEIARAAGVSHMTFFRHFPTKEAVVMDDPYDPMIAEAIVQQPTHLPALERVRRAIQQSWQSVEAPDEESMRRKLRLVAGHRGLRARAWENNHRTETAVVQALVHTGVQPFEAKLAAGAMLGALTSAILDWAEDEDRRSLGEQIRDALAHVASWTGGDAR